MKKMPDDKDSTFRGILKKASEITDASKTTNPSNITKKSSKISKKSSKISKKASKFINASKITKASSKVIESETDVENEEIQLRLIRLTSLVPTMPKDRPLTSYQIIKYVIEYISLLEQALGAHSGIHAAAMQAAAAVMFCSAGHQSSTNVPGSVSLHRQPLKVLAANANVSVNCKTTSPDTSMDSSSRQSDKVSSTTSNNKQFPC